MNNYLLDNVVEFNPILQKEKTLLIVHKLHRTPYHIGIVFGDSYYALTVNGPEQLSKQTIFDLLIDKTHNNLIVEINHSGKTVESVKYFHDASLDHVSFKSCLFPVRDLLAELTANNKLNEANNLFELLDMLFEFKLVGQIMATRMSPLMESKLVLMRYDTDAIKKHIKRLQEIDAREQNKKHNS